MWGYKECTQEAHWEVMVMWAWTCGSPRQQVVDLELSGSASGLKALTTYSQAAPLKRFLAHIPEKDDC